jgi:drug/metabolite transporter (DMT)-like permease
MTWFTFVIINIIATILVGILDYGFQKWTYKTPEFPAILWAFFFLFYWIYSLSWGIHENSLFVLFLSFFSWLLTFLWVLSYFRAIFSPTTPGFIWTVGKIQMIFAFLIGIFVFWEMLSSKQLLGHGLIFAWAIIVSLDHIQEGKNKKAIFYSMSMALSYAFANSICKYLYWVSDFNSVFGIYCIWIFAWAMICAFFTQNGKRFFQEFITRPQYYFWLWLVTEFFWVLQFVSQNMAIAKWPLTVVVFLMETYVAFLLILSVFLAPIFPKYIPKEWGNNTLKNLIIIWVMFIGIWLTLS